MRSSKAALAGLLLSATLSRAGCSPVHDFLNPPEFSSPPSSTPSAIVPTYVAPGSTLAELHLSGEESKSTSFTTRSNGFTINLSCRAKSDTRVKVRIELQGAERTVTAACLAKFKPVFELVTPGVADDDGPNAKLTANAIGRLISAVDIQVVSGAS